MTNQAEAERPLGLVPSQPGGRVQDGLQFTILGQLAFLGSNPSGDHFELSPVRQVVLDDDHQLLQLGRDLHDRR